MPAAHATHALAPLAEYLPTVHWLQVDAVVAAEVAEAVPAKQPVQAEEPAADA